MPCPARFAWEGFSFGHPEDWSPVSLTGARDAGYVRLQGQGRAGIQVRWQASKRAASPERLVEDYFRRLERDAKKARTQFRREMGHSPRGLAYRFQGTFQHRGEAFSASDGRVFLAEAFGGRTDSLLPAVRDLIESFSIAEGSGLEPWSLFGMAVLLPHGLTPASKLLQSGRTWLTFRPRGAVIETGRYGFGEELIRRHGLESWSRAALAMPHAHVSEEQGGLRLELPARLYRPPVSALVLFQPDQNQLVAVKAAAKDAKWRPEWRWLNSSDS